jgi:hypothetical protein
MLIVNMMVLTLRPDDLDLVLSLTNLQSVLLLTKCKLNKQYSALVNISSESGSGSGSTDL